MDSHDSHIYRELLTQFRDGFARFGKASLLLRGLTTTQPVVLPEAERECLLKEIGRVSWPVGPAEQSEEESFRVWGALAHPHHTGQPELRAFSLEALDCFCSLAERAGAHLPRSVLHSLPLIPYRPAPDAASRWYSLLWWLPAVGHSDNSAREGDRTVSFSPFEDSARAIEVCGLAADTSAPPPAAKPKNGKGNGGGSSAPGQPATDPNVKRKEVLKKLQPADRKAYLSFEYAQSKVGKRLEDHEAHEWLKENGIDTEKGDAGELADYQLPVFDTWSRKLRNARPPLGEQKYTRRDGRVTGRSIVSGRDIERQQRDNA